MNAHQHKKHLGNDPVPADVHILQQSGTNGTYYTSDAEYEVHDGRGFCFCLGVIVERHFVILLQVHPHKHNHNGNGCGQEYEVDNSTKSIIKLLEDNNFTNIDTVNYNDLVSIIVPLMVSSYETSIQLADAMEVRGFVSNKKRTRYNIRKFSWLDLFSLLTVCALCAGLFVAAYANEDIILAIFGYKDSITILR